MIVKLLTEHHLELISLKGGCTGVSESTLVKMPHCWKSHVTAKIIHEQSCKILLDPSNRQRCHNEGEVHSLQNRGTSSE